MHQSKYPVTRLAAAAIFSLCLLAVALVSMTLAQSYLCGDANGDTIRDIGDAVHIVAYIFKGGPPPEPPIAADVNADGSINVGDAVHLIDWIFKGGPEPICEREGALVDYSICKMTGETALADSIPSNQDCLAYTFDGASTLTMTHINAGFNCCPFEMVVTFRFPGDTVVIDETGIDGFCDCECLFDLDMTVKGITPGRYTLRVLEPERHPDDPPLEFTVDLIGSTSGIFCVPRNYYPWGY